MKSRILGTVACCIGFLGVLVAVLAHHVVERKPELAPGWKVEISLSDKVSLNYGNLPEPQPEPVRIVSRDNLTLAAIALGCVTIALAVASWIRREGISLGVIAAFLGASAIAWQQVVVVLVLFVLAGGPTLWYQWPLWERQNTIK